MKRFDPSDGKVALSKRQREFIEMLLQSERVGVHLSIDDMARQMGVSYQTVRQYLYELETAGAIERVRSGKYRVIKVAL